MSQSQRRSTIERLPVAVRLELIRMREATPFPKKEPRSFAIPFNRDVAAVMF